MDELEEDVEVEIDLAAHGPNWLVGRSGITRKTKKDLPTRDNKKSAELTKRRTFC